MEHVIQLDQAGGIIQSRVKGFTAVSGFSSFASQSYKNVHQLKTKLHFKLSSGQKFFKPLRFYIFKGIFSENGPI